MTGQVFGFFLIGRWSNLCGVAFPDRYSVRSKLFEIFGSPLWSPPPV